MAQVTLGGSSKNWEQYSIVYDTIVKDELVSSAYPLTSTTYLRFSFLTGRGLMSEPQRLYYPEFGFYGIEGHDFNRAYEVAFGGYGNYEGVNKNLHPAIDLSGNTEISFQFGSPGMENNPDPDFSVDYGLYYSLGVGYGPMATIKPAYLSNGGSSILEKLSFDIGYRPEIQVYSYSSTEYDFAASGAYGTIAVDDIGVRLDGNFFIGLRYGALGVRYEVSNMLTTLYSPLVYHQFYFPDGSYGSNEIEMNVLYRFNKLSLMLFF